MMEVYILLLILIILIAAVMYWPEPKQVTGAYELVEPMDLPI